MELERRLHQIQGAQLGEGLDRLLNIMLNCIVQGLCASGPVKVLEARIGTDETRTLAEVPARRDRERSQVSWLDMVRVCLFDLHAADQVGLRFDDVTRKEYFVHLIDIKRPQYRR